MVPQYPVNNRKSWASIEKATRKYIMRAEGDVFVITAPVFNVTSPTIGAHKVGCHSICIKLSMTLIHVVLGATGSTKQIKLGLVSH